MAKNQKENINNMQDQIIIGFLGLTIVALIVVIMLPSAAKQKAPTKPPLFKPVPPIYHKGHYHTPFRSALESEIDDQKKHKPTKR